MSTVAEKFAQAQIDASEIYAMRDAILHSAGIEFAARVMKRPSSDVAEPAVNSAPEKTLKRPAASMKKPAHMDAKPLPAEEAEP
eukprot:12313049-Alexandrium_andersonii.AAC.1